VSWLLPRLAVAVAAVVTGALTGAVVARPVGLAVLGAVAGAAVGVAVIVLVDALRGQRVVRWLRGAQEHEAPRDTGFWGEVGYRAERALRGRDKEIEHERGRLEQFLSAIEASPNGVLLLDANDQIEWCSTVAADHFGLDPELDRRQRVTNLVRAPAFVAHLQAGQFDEPLIVKRPRGGGMLSVLVRPYGTA
jgi:two-component system phosphate regulon sensor histidine kinase PhoR